MASTGVNKRVNYAFAPGYGNDPPPCRAIGLAFLDAGLVKTPPIFTDRRGISNIDETLENVDNAVSEAESNRLRPRGRATQACDYIRHANNPREIAIEKS